MSGFGRKINRYRRKAPVSVPQNPDPVFGTPAAPTDVTATATSQTSIRVDWAVGDNGGSPVTTSNVYQFHNGNPAPVVAYPVPSDGTTLSVTNLGAGINYTFQVVRTNAIGSSPPSAISNSVLLTPNATVPDPADNLLATPGPQSMTVTWRLNFNGGSPFTAGTLRVYANGSPAPTGAYGPLAAGSSSYVVPGLNAANTYSFDVILINAVGSAAPSTKTPPRSPIQPPGPPTNLGISGAPNAIYGSWTPPVDPLPVLEYSYRVFRGADQIATGTTTGVGFFASNSSFINDDTAPYTFVVTARTAAGVGQVSGSSPAGQPNWWPVEIKARGAWTGVTHVNNDPTTLVLSTESGRANGISLTHEGVSGSIRSISELVCEDPDYRLLENDEWVFFLPHFVPSAGFTSGSAYTTIYRLANAAGRSSLEFRANDVGLALTIVTNGTTVYDQTRAWGTSNTQGSATLRKDNWNGIWLRLYASRTSSGWVEWGDGPMAQGGGPQNGAGPPSSNRQGRINLPILSTGDGYLQVCAGNNNSAPISTARFVRRDQLTGWRRNRAGENSVDGWQRKRFDPDFTKVVVHPTNGQNYNAIKANGSQDRVNIVYAGGRLSWKHLVKANDTVTGGSGERAEAAVTRRPVTKVGASGYDPGACLMMFAEGDKVVWTTHTYFPDAATFPLNPGTKYKVITQGHQMAESGSGSPPVQAAFTSASPSTLWRYIFSASPAEAGSLGGFIANMGDPPERLVWQDVEVAMTIKSAATGYIRVKKNGTLLASGTGRKTLYDPNGTTMSTGEVLGADLPEYIYWQEGLYKELPSNGGDPGQSLLYHSGGEALVYRDPTKTRVVDRPLLT